MNDAYRRSHLAFYEKHHPRWAPLLRLYLRLKGQLPSRDGRAPAARRDVRVRRLRDRPDLGRASGLKAVDPSSANRHRRAQAARLRHRHLRPQSAAAPVAHRSRRPSTSSSAAARTAASLAELGENFRAVAESSAAVLDPRAAGRAAGPAARAGRPVSRAALRPAAADAVPVGRDDPRLHPPAVPAVPAEPARPTPTRARRCGSRRTGRARVLTVSEASKRDILRYFRVPEAKIDVIYNAIDERFGEPPDDEEVARVRERYQLNDPFVLYAGNIKPHKNLERLIEAFHMLPQGRARARQAADHRRRDLEVRDAAAGGAPLQAAQARAVLRLRPGQDAGGAVSAGRRVRVSVAVRGLRPAAARGDGQRHAGDHVERVVAAGGRRRRRAADRSVRSGRHRRRRCAAC